MLLRSDRSGRIARSSDLAEYGPRPDDDDALTELLALQFAAEIVPDEPIRRGEGTSRSTRHGYRPCSRRDVEIYLISEASQCSPARAAERVGANIKPRAAQLARARGARVARSYAGRAPRRYEGRASR